MARDPEPAAPPNWCCPVCRLELALADGARVWACPAGHRFDVARQGYVNLLVAGQRRSRQPGDSPEMVRARQRFLATGAYDPLTAAVAEGVAATAPEVVLDVGCGEGRHTRALGAPAVLGIDVAKAAVAVAARAHAGGRYAVASAGDIPLGDGVVDAAVIVFGPAVPDQLARIVRRGGSVVTAHPGPDHLAGLRSLVYRQSRPHEVKGPLRHGDEWFDETGSWPLTWPLTVPDAAALDDLFTMTPYRWHATADIRERLAGAGPFSTVADVRITTYRRR